MNANNSPIPANANAPETQKPDDQDQLPELLDWQ